VKTLARDEVVPLYYPEFDVTRPEKVRLLLQELRPGAVINTAAFHRVDECEDQPEASFRVNAVAVRDLARLASELGFILIHFSTDYVFDAGRGALCRIRRAQPPQRLRRLQAGRRVFRPGYRRKALLGAHLRALRFGSCREKGYNFVDRMIALADEGKPIRVVDDQWVSPTSAEELAARVSDLLRTDHYGLYHLTSEGQCTWFEFAAEVFSLLEKSPRLEPVPSRVFAAKARRPSIPCSKTSGQENRLRDFSDWKKALRTYLERKSLIPK